MTIPITTVGNNQTFGTWLQRTNDICTIISQNAVTVDTTTNGSISVGNGFINGAFGAVILFTNDVGGNVTINSTSINTSWGLLANSSKLICSANLYSNNLNVGNGITICNSSGSFVNGEILCNTLVVSNYFSVNSTSSYSNNLVVNGSTNVVTLSIQTSANVGALVSLNTSSVSVNQSIINSSAFVIGNNTSTVSPLIYLSNSTGNVNLTVANISTSWGLTSNSSTLSVNTIFVGNSSGLFSNASSIGQVTSNSFGLYAISFNTNSISANSSSIGQVTSNSFGLYANVGYINNITTNTISACSTVGNSSGLYTTNLNVNNTLSIINGSSFSTNTTINSSSLFIGNSSWIFMTTNSSGIFTNNSITVSGNLFVSGNITSTGTSVANGDFIPVTNSYNLGNTSNRWSLWALTINAVANTILQANLFVNNTIIIGNSSVNAVVNSSIYSGTSNNTSFVGSVTAANVVSNAQLQANLGNYVATNDSSFGGTANNTSFVGSVTAANVVSNAQLQANLGNYQATSTLDANIASYMTTYLPIYTGVLNSSSISVGTSTTNISINATAVLLSNSSSSLNFSVPTSTQSSNTQYYFNANGSWSYLPVSNGSFTGNTIAAATIDSYLMTNYRGAKYIVSCIDNTANNKYFSELLTTHDTFSGYITEYGMITTNSAIGTFSVSTNTTSVLLQFTSAGSANVTISFVRIIM